MLILQLGGMGSHQSKPNSKSRAAQFLRDEGIPISKSPFIPPQLNGTSTATSPNPPNGGNLPWEHNDPPPGRRPWRPSVQGPLVGNISTPSLSPASPSLSTFSTSSDGLTPASSTFSRFSSASSVTSPPTSPLSSGRSVRRRPIGNDPFRHDLRLAASSPSLFAAASSPRPQRPQRTQRPQRPSIPRANIPLTPKVFPDRSSGSGPRRRQNSLDEQWPALQPANSPTMNSAPLRPQHAPSHSLTALWQSVSSGSYHMMTQEEQDRAIAQLLQESLLLNPQAYGDSPTRSSSVAPPPTAPPAVLQEELDREYAERLQREEEVEAANAQNASPPSPRPSSNGFRPSRTPSSPRAGNDLHPNNPFHPDNPWSNPRSNQQSLNNNDDLYDEGPSSRRRPPTHASLQQMDEDMRIAIRTQEEEEAEMRRANAAPRTRECVVCSEATPIPDFPSLMNCAHEPQVCGDCYKTWISSQLDNRSWKEIGCPDSGCKELLGHVDVQHYAAPEVYLK